MIGEQEAPARADSIVPKKKRKKSKRPKSKRGLGKPTGFEEYYVDAPMTPTEHEAEEEIYSQSRPIIHRIEDALQRYQKNRRLENNRRAIFLKYLAYGGVDVSPKMFEGTDQKDLQELDSEQILQAKTQTSIATDSAKLPIDFDAVVRGFLTSYFPFYFNPETEDMIKLGTVTIRNFLCYLIYHNVCPEYTINIREAIDSCDTATEELWLNQQFMVKGPGHFNKACSTLFGGERRDCYREQKEEESSSTDEALMTKDVAHKVVKFALAGAGTDHIARGFREQGNINDLHAIRISDIDGFEIIAIDPPKDTITDFYEKFAPDLVPVGRIVAKSFMDPARASCDMTPEEREQVPPVYFFNFFLEQPLMQLCYVGMKVLTPVWVMDCGLHYFEETFCVYTSDYTVLPNDLMLGWKKPRPVNGSAAEDEFGADEGESPKQNNEIADVQEVL
ncbi:uncharacterized protein BP01DRAFT_342179 [Aspergillus saccharolyticus JOP 1030-1]|uniref:Uncharacterized protein n=1 Tax=Aspergillus saccharolyticus JOP 1030-1 TaxID=1450539 RepID=A0A318ZIV4_9EURO|nr:hypothetical protein BP01DRAFT_342179 [Aspergillus saccharolyticus JOP 1030-1]PYH44503.1 hypothetical protein BP01DRAFT_342179 [Aspergillus saccharolyticus JOP 1030-1]